MPTPINVPNRLTYEYVRDSLKKLGYDLVTQTYQNANQKLAVICQNKHKRLTTFQRIAYKKPKCAKCDGIDRRLHIEEIRNIFTKEKYSLLSTVYINAHQKLSVLCPAGHEWNINVNKFKNRGDRCPECSFKGGYSRMEQELFSIIKSYYTSTKKHKTRNIRIKDRPHIGGFDIDIYIPELNKGIEFDGKYFHSIVGLSRGLPKWPKKDIEQYHAIKDNYFKSKGILILHIKEEEWKANKQEMVYKCLAFLSNKI